MNIVLVEDGPEDAKKILHLMGEANISRESVAVADTLKKTLKLVQGRDVDLVLLDLDLADSKSINTVRAVRSVTDAAIVVLSSCDDEMECVNCLSAGADNYILKSSMTAETLYSAVCGGVTWKQIRGLKNRLNANFGRLCAVGG